MQDERRKGVILSADDIDKLAAVLSEKITFSQNACPMSLQATEVTAIRELIQTKRNAVKAFLALIGALCLWVLKDVYLWLVAHTSIK